MNHYCRVCRHTHPLWTHYRNSNTIVCGYCGYRERDRRLPTGPLLSISRPGVTLEKRYES